MPEMRGLLKGFRIPIWPDVAAYFAAQALAAPEPTKPDAKLHAQGAAL